MTIQFKAIITDTGNSPYKLNDLLHISYPKNSKVQVEPIVSECDSDIPRDTGYVTKNNIKRFKELYDNAVSESRSEFVFEGQVILTEFAKYMLEHASNEGLDA